MSDGKELVIYNESLPVTSDLSNHSSEKEEIRIYTPQKRRKKFKAFNATCRFIALTAVFAAIFYLFYYMPNMV